jgi:small-conductance mechanosensitive channel
MHLFSWLEGRVRFCLVLCLSFILTFLGDTSTASPNIAVSPQASQLYIAQVLPGSKAEEANEVPEVPQPELEFPNGNRVVLGDETLFFIESSAGALSNNARAAEISEQIQEFARNRSLPLSSLYVKEYPDGLTVDIKAQDNLLMSVYKADANATGESQAGLAQLYLAEISEGVAQYRALYSPRSILIGAIKTAIATIVLGTAFWGINLVFQLGKTWFSVNARHRIRTIRIGSREVIHERQINQALRFLANLLRYFFFFVLGSIYLRTVLSFFPQTRSAADGLFRPFFSAIGQILEGIIGYIPKLIFLVVLAIITFYALKIIRFLFEEIDQGEFSIPGFDQEWAVPTSRIAQILTLALAAVIAFPYLPGANSDAFQGISIFLGILISLGSSSAISNLIAGILLTYTRAFQIGDEVEIGGVGGTLVEKGVLVVRILTWEHTYVSIPNSEVLSSHVTNFRKGGKQVGESSPPPIVVMEFGFGYEVPWQKAYDILLKAARSYPGILPEPASFVLHERLADSCALYTLRMFTSEPENAWWIKSHVLKYVQEICISEGIDLIVPEFYVNTSANGDGPIHQEARGKQSISLL